MMSMIEERTRGELVGGCLQGSRYVSGKCYCFEALLLLYIAAITCIEICFRCANWLSTTPFSPFSVVAGDKPQLTVLTAKRVHNVTSEVAGCRHVCL